MNTTKTHSSARRMTAAALMVAAAGALAVGGLGAAATANAKPGIENPAPSRPTAQRAPSTDTGIEHSGIALADNGVWATFTNARSFTDFNNGVLSACQNAGGSHCVVVGVAKAPWSQQGNQCVALSVHRENIGDWNVGYGTSNMSSMNAALQGFGGQIATTACTQPNGVQMSFTGRVGQLSSETKGGVV